MHSRVEIDLAAIRHNYKQIRSLVPSNTEIMAVVKAEAYGHGLIEVAHCLEKTGVDRLAVTEIAEGVRLREAGVGTQILVFGPFLTEEIPLAIVHNLTLTVSSFTQLDALSEMGEQIEFHLKLETGLGRTGFKETELSELLHRLRATGLKPTAAYSHLATAMWTDKTFAERQFRTFLRLAERINDEYPEVLLHLANSAALQKYPEMHLDIVRVGTLLYGQNVLDAQLKLKNTWRLKTRIIHLNELEAGNGIGYEQTTKLKRHTRTAVLPVGFAHGYSLEPSGRAGNFKQLLTRIAKTVLAYIGRRKDYVLIHGKKAPILGKVGMQQLIVDISSIPEAGLGDDVELFARRTAVAHLPYVYLDADGG